MNRALKFKIWFNSDVLKSRIKEKEFKKDLFDLMNKYDISIRGVKLLWK